MNFQTDLYIYFFFMIQCFPLYEAGCQRIGSVLRESKTEKAPGVNLFMRHDNRSQHTVTRGGQQAHGMTSSEGALIKLKTLCVCIHIYVYCISVYSASDEIRDRENVQTKRAIINNTMR